MYWPPIGRVRERLGIPVVANGDIWTVEDFRRCRDETGCRHFMLGRGALADPRLPRRVAAELGLVPGGTGRRGDRPVAGRISWAVVGWTRAVRRGGRPGGCPCRLKQWLSLAAAHGDFAGFDAVKRAKTVNELLAVVGGMCESIPSRTYQGWFSGCHRDPLWTR